MQINLVLKCIAGTLGFLGCNTTETPEDQNLLLFFVPGIFFANSFGNFPTTFEKATPPFSITSPLIVLNSPYFHLFFLNFLLDPYVFSNSSMFLQINFCNSKNHFLTICCFFFNFHFSKLIYFVEDFLQEL